MKAPFTEAVGSSSILQSSDSTLNSDPVVFCFNLLLSHMFIWLMIDLGSALSVLY